MINDYQAGWKGETFVLAGRGVQLGGIATAPGIVTAEVCLLTSDAKSNENDSAIFGAVLGVLGFRCQAFCVIFWRFCPHNHHDHHNKTRLRDKQIQRHFDKVGEGYQAVIPLSASSCALEWLLDCSYGGAMPQVLLVIIIFDIIWTLER